MIRLVLLGILSFVFSSIVHANGQQSFEPNPVLAIVKNKSKSVKSGNSVGANATDLGDFYVGGGPVDVTFGWYRGTQSEPSFFKLHTGTLSGPSDFTVLSDGCSGATLGPVCNVTVRFNALTAGFKKGKYTIGFTGHLSDGTTYGGTVSHSIYASVVEVPLAADANPPAPNATKCIPGSIIRSDAQSLSEVVDIVGTPFKLFYSTEFANAYLSPYNTVNRKSYFDPEGWTISVHHYYDIDQRRLFKGTGTSEVRRFQAGELEVIKVVSSDLDEVYEFDMSGKHLRTLTGLTGATKYTFYYSATGTLTGIEDAYGKMTGISRNTAGEMTAIIAPFGQTTNISVNGAGLISAITNPKSETHSFTYKSGTDLLETYTKPGGQVSTFSYDSSGRLTQDLGNGGNFWSFLQTLQPAERKLTQTSNLGRTTSHYSWAEYGDIYSSAVYPSGYETESGESDIFNYQWSPLVETGSSSKIDERFGILSTRPEQSYVIINGQMSTTSYGKTVVNPIGGNDLFNFSSITDTKTTSGRTSTTVFDNSTKTFTTTTAEGATSQAQVNILEEPISFKVGNDTPWTYTYNSLGQLTVVAQGTHNTLTNLYNTSGYLQKKTNVRGEEVSYVYDTAGRVVQEVRPDGKVVAYSHDSNGKVIGVTPPSRPEHIFGFNSMELMSSYEPPALTGLTTKNTLYSYNLDQQLTNILRPDGQSAAYTYNSTTGLLNQVAVSRGNYSYQYQANTELVSQLISPDDIKTTYEYYGLTQNSEEQKRNSDGYLFGKVSFGYDGDHRVISRTVRGHNASSISTINTTYNNDDKPIQIGSLQLGYSYPSGRLSTTVLDNISDTRTYDSYGNLESYSAIYTPTGGSAQTLYSYTLTRDLGSRIIGKSETVLGVTDTYVYTYDVAGRLKTITKNGSSYSNYNYDDNGNRTSGTSAGQTFTATYDNQDRMLTLNSRVFTYNANGDVIHTQWHPTQQSSYVWDSLGNMISAVSTSGNALEFKYDGKNRWVQTIVDGATTTRRIYENDYRIAAQYTDGGFSVKEFIYATNVNSPDYMLVAGVKYRLIKDHLGSPRLVVKSTDGTVAQRIDYTELGRVLTNTNTSMQPYGFAGGIMENYTRFVKFGARFYDTEVGRWTSRDPILFDGADMNLYGYVQNDPINFIDPSGKIPDNAVDAFRCVERFGNGFESDISGQIAEIQNEIRQIESIMKANNSCQQIPYGGTWENRINVLKKSLEGKQRRFDNYMSVCKSLNLGHLVD